jgi:hypothetical protein
MKISLHASRCFLALLLFVPGLMVKAQVDQYTPLIVSPLTPGTHAFLGTDGKMHLVYELVLTNASPTSATLQKVEAVDASDPSHVLASWEGKTLLTDLRTTGNTQAASPVIPFNETRLLLLQIALDKGAPIPSHLLHRLTLLGASSPARMPATPVAQTYTVASIAVGTNLPVISQPLAGKGWVALNGCCEAASAHRSTGLPVNGALHFAQRFAIDWMKLDAEGRLVHGDPSDVHNYVGYGADVLAVADGTIVGMLDTLGDQKPGSLPDPKTINIQNVDGNHVVLDLGNGVYAFYAHLQKGSISVAIGDKVKRGQVLGKLGNTGNTSAPHLHFHLMDGPSVLGSSGIPYVIDSFDYDGQIPEQKFAAASGIEGNWGEARLATPAPRHDEFPMDLAIIDFAGQ